ncbi:ParB, partition protein [Burkholderia pseudomallei]|nr:ParB, partition protein [Burkholderia pseudomallei]CAJ6692853.1 ParB, partition protein [Burkholderia pseudomallei]
MSMRRMLRDRAAPDTDLEPLAPSKRPPNEDRPRTGPGGLLAAQGLITAAEDEAAAAKAEAAEAKGRLDDALRRIAELEASHASDEGEETDLNDFVEVPGRRRVLSPIERAELTENLRKNKLATPITYRLLPDGKKEIVSGHNRIDIYRNVLGRTKIRAVPFNGTKEEAELAAAFANLLAPSLPDYEKYRQFVRLQVEAGFTRADIIEASGLSKQHVQKILSFEKLPKEALDAIALRPDRVGGNAAEEFAGLVASGNTEGVIKAIQALVADESMTQKNALALARPKVARQPPPQARTIKIGRNKFCDVAVRRGVIGLTFAGKGTDADARAQMWADKIEAFIRHELEAEDADPSP